MNIRFCDLDKMIVFGKKTDGKLAFIDEVENGYDCDCFCLNCNAKLNAKNRGIKKAHHFAHAINSDCKKGHENTIPLFIQRIINKNKRMLLPRGNIKLNDKYLNNHQTVSVNKTELVNVENFPRVVIATTQKGKEIAIYAVLTEEDLSERQKVYFKNFENVIEIDLRQYRNSNLEVEASIEDVLIHQKKNVVWKKRYDEEPIKKKIKELSCRKSFGIDIYGFEHFYCPFLERNTTSKTDKCNECPFYVNNIIKDAYDNGCIGFIEGELSVNTIFTATKPDLSLITGPSFFELRSLKQNGYYWFAIRDLPKAYPNIDCTLIYNFDTKSVYLVSLKSFSEGIYLGIKIDEEGNFMNIPMNLLNYARIRSWRICSLANYKINQEHIDCLKGKIKMVRNRL